MKANLITAAGRAARTLCEPVEELAVAQASARLEEGTIDLYLVRYAAESDVALADVYRTFLSDEEREQETRFYFERDRRQYLLTRALLRTTLSRYAGVDPREWHFRTNRWGKPEVANVTLCDLGIEFNLSHTRGLIALAVTKGKALGVDVERPMGREATAGLAEHYFTPAEACRLQGLVGAERQDSFFSLWTLKEAYVKARGLGLSIPMSDFCFRFPAPGRIGFEAAPHLEDCAERWQFWLFRPTEESLLALCAERFGMWRVSARWTVPLVSEQAFALQMLCCSCGVVV